MMTRISHWRRTARSVIFAAIEDAKPLGLKGESLREFVFGRYPFGARAMWPYKIWLSEVKSRLDPATEAHAKPGDVPVDYWTSLLSGGPT